MSQQRAELPMAQERDALLSMLARPHGRCVVLTGETGCGKTTQVPQYILEDAILNGRGAEVRVVCTQPRRLSAISVAERVGEEMGVAVEHPRALVGYHVRRQRCVAPTARLVFCTTGILLRMLQGDKELSQFTHIIVDEVHERSVNGDFLLIVLRDLLRARPTLRVVLMSATVEAERFSCYFGGLPTMSVCGRTFPVSQLWLEDIIERSGYTTDVRWCLLDDVRIAADKRAERLAELAESGVYRPATLDMLRRLDEAEISNELIVRCLELAVEDGNWPDDAGALVFLPGLREISNLAAALSEHAVFGDARRCSVFALHSMLAPQEQRDAFRRLPRGRRKVVLATNIAETSITIPDIVVVVDTGRLKEMRYESQSKLHCLTDAWVSRAAAKQRRGRAGRVRDGFCYALYSSAQHDLMDPYQVPEMLRCPLEELCLQVLSLGMATRGVRELLRRAFDPPNGDHVAAAMELLLEIGAVDGALGAESLTPLGRRLSQLPVDVRLGKMLVYAAALRCLSPVLTMTAAMSVKSPFIQSVARGGDRSFDFAKGSHSDHWALVNVYDAWQRARGDRTDAAFCREHGLSAKTLCLIEETRREFRAHLAEQGLCDGEPDQHARNHALVSSVLFAGLSPNLAKAEPVAGGLRFLTLRGTCTCTLPRVTRACRGCLRRG